MENEELLSTLKSLREAIQISPDNLPLKSLYVDNLLKAGKHDEAMEELKKLVKDHPENLQFRLFLAKIYLQRMETNKGIVLIENIVKSGNAPPEFILLYIRLMIEEKRYEIASEYYRTLLINSPASRDESIEASLTKSINCPVTDLDAELDELLEIRKAPVPIEKPKIKFDDVGGMARLKEEISFKIIQPLQHKKLFTAYGKKPGGGILLYGPPGCGKTHIARATAGETNSLFISVGIHEVLNMYIGQSENNLHSLFEYARKNTPAVLFFDEADALGSSRTDMKNFAGRYTINQFLMELDGDKYSNEGILILAATNAPWHMDPAFLRPGRFDRLIFVPPPDVEARSAILKIVLKDKPISDIDFQKLAEKTEGFSGADLVGMVDVAVECILREVLHSDKEIPLTTGDLLKSLRSLKPSTREWFNTAKNYVIYSNESGLYDDIARYLNLKK